ncbi:hypothetical protein ACFQ3N_05895 [Virgibacillus byunsanensis]|uniref:Uncharacterized protein n=1 Tax=Virgibacillus byunsanensis TaxID=570945 RepID=A0ABW3LKA7_9BACI
MFFISKVEQKLEAAVLVDLPYRYEIKETRSDSMLTYRKEEQEVQ